jgi:hypothetical protein
MGVPRIGQSVLVGLATLAVVGVAVFAALELGQAARTNQTPKVPGTSTTSLPWVTYAAEVIGVRPGGDDRTAIVQLSLPAGRPDCARDPHIKLFSETNDAVTATVLFSSASSSVIGACPSRTTVELSLSTPGPLAGRRLSLGGTYPWVLRGNGYVHCQEFLGCDPPTDHCAPQWIDKAVFGLDVSVKHIRGVRTERGCDGNWLVLDIDRSVGACQPVDGKSTCSVPADVTRFFLEWRSENWVQFAGTRQAGCADAKATRPDFPTALCENLPAVR